MEQIYQMTHGYKCSQVTPFLIFLIIFSLLFLDTPLGDKTWGS